MKVGLEMTKQASKNKKFKQDPKTGVIIYGGPQDTNKNGTAGRPSSYDDKFIQMMIDFFNTKPYEDIPFIQEFEQVVKPDGSTRTKAKQALKRVAAELPTFEKFAFDIGVHYTTLQAWAVETTDPSNEMAPLKHPEFSYAYGQCQQIQKYFLIQNGLQGTYPAQAFIFVAKNATDMTDVRVVETRDDDETKGKLDAISNWANSLQHDAQSTT